MTALRVVGGSILARNMRTRATKLQDRKAPNARAVIYVDGWIQKNFKSQGKPVGGWKPLAPATVAQRRKGSSTILQDIGDLKKKWRHFWNNRTGWLKSAVPYGGYHDKGEGVPKRQILPDKKQVMPAIKKIFGKFVETSLK